MAAGMAPSWLPAGFPEKHRAATGIRSKPEPASSMTFVIFPKPRFARTLILTGRQTLECVGLSSI